MFQLGFGFGDRPFRPAAGGVTLEAFILDSLGAYESWQASELVSADGGRTILTEGPWISSEPFDNGEQDPYPGTISGCIIGAEYGFVVEDGHRFASSTAADAVGVHDCGPTSTPVAIGKAIGDVVFGGPAIEFGDDGSTLSLTGDSGALVFRSPVGAVEVALDSAELWAATDVDGVAPSADLAAVDGLTLRTGVDVGGCLLFTTFDYTLSAHGQEAVLDLEPTLADFDCELAESDRALSEPALAILEARPRLQFALDDAGALQLMVIDGTRTITFAPAPAG